MATLVHVGVRCKNLEPTLRFWRDALGSKLINTFPDSVDLTDGQHNFRVFQHAGPERPPHVSGILDYLHIGVRVDNFQAAAQRLADLGFDIFWDGVAQSHAYEYDPAHPPSESFKVSDPDGIVVDVSASRDQWPGVTL